MINILILGAGKIGSLAAFLLSNSGDYHVFLADIQKENQPLHSDTKFFQFDANNQAELEVFIKQHQIAVVLSALPYYCNVQIAETSKKLSLHYFDLTEDVSVTEAIIKISQGAETAFIPQCGLAPGYISIATQHLIKKFEKLDVVKMRVGALPVRPSNALKYSLTWSTDGLINEYGNTCYGIKDGIMTSLQPLEGYETIEIDGKQYESFNTSGGLGTLAETHMGSVNVMNYKTVRYPGHCEKIRFLMNDLKLNEDRDTLKRVLEKAIPKTHQDVVLIYASVSGWRNNQLYEDTYFKKVYPQIIGNKNWSAIQITTASGVCSVIDIVMKSPEKYQGFVTQESFELEIFQKNRFGKVFH